MPLSSSSFIFSIRTYKLDFSIFKPKIRGNQNWTTYRADAILLFTNRSIESRDRVLDNSFYGPSHLFIMKPTETFCVMLFITAVNRTKFFFFFSYYSYAEIHICTTPKPSVMWPTKP